MLIIEYFPVSRQNFISVFCNYFSLFRDLYFYDIKIMSLLLCVKMKSKPECNITSITTTM